MFRLRKSLKPTRADAGRLVSPIAPTEEYGVAPAAEETHDQPLPVDLEKIEREILTPPEQPRENYQFSLAELCGLMVATSVFLSTVSIFSRSMGAFAGATGLLILVAMVVIELLNVQRAIVRVGWWAALVMYLVMCIVAAINS